MPKDESKSTTMKGWGFIAFTSFVTGFLSAMIIMNTFNSRCHCPDVIYRSEPRKFIYMHTIGSYSESSYEHS